MVELNIEELKQELNDDIKTSWPQQRRFMLGGRAVFTVVNKNSRKRYTYKVIKPNYYNQPNAKPVYFIRILTAPAHYEFLGTIFTENGKPISYKHGRNTRISITAPSALLLRDWILPSLFHDKPLPSFLEFYHEGRCGMCGKELTVPESIRSGIGPICAGKIGL